MVERSLPWLMRGMWVIVLLVGSETLDGALEDNGRATALRVAALIAWIAGVAAMAVPSVGSLTEAPFASTPTFSRKNAS